MKKSILLCLLTTVSLISCANDKLVPTTEIPQEAKEYIKAHFPENNVTQAIKDRDGLSVSYDILLDDFTSLEFKRGDIKEVKSKGKKQLPNSVIPAAILTYVQQSYPNNHIIEWKWDDRKQKVELDNQIELEFNKKGEFLRIDY